MKAIDVIANAKRNEPKFILTPRMKEAIEEVLGFACKEGYLDADDANAMTDQERWDYYQKCVEQDLVASEPF